MPSALITGGGRGIGANIARRLAADDWDVIVTARSRDQIEAVAAETGGRAIAMDVTDPASVTHGFDEAGHVDLLVANAGIGHVDWWRIFEVNVLGVHLTCEAALARGVGRIVVIGSGAGYLPGASETAYTSSKAAVNRYAETLNNAVAIPVFLVSPGRVKTALTEGNWPDDDPGWTPPELAPELVAKLASGRYDVLAGRYIHAEHDDVDDLLARADEVRERDLNAIRLQR
ncbi:MAG TPA: SDR family NAD(P)-dependent oxidoreductase [Gaiellaceae bacterium]|nr:SDR family NAD(P)-dependent oxidoreductase [Gaiellaceae bacterium]